MNCSYCFTQFDHLSHTPRLLIFCGHSLCEQCCKQLHVNSRIQCPECFSNTFIQQVNFLPKNLALLKVNSSNSSNDALNCCLKHEKKYEAFCKKQKILLCVDCILHDNHRNHQMDSIKNAHYVQQASLKQAIQNVQNLLNLTQSKYQENLNSERQFEEMYQTNSQSIMQIFQDLKQLIEKQQQMIKTKLKQHYQASLVKFNEKNSKYSSKIEQLSCSLANLKQSIKQSDIQFLSCVNQRDQVISRVQGNVQQALKITSINYSKNAIADIITKSIQKNFKVNISNSQQVKTVQGQVNQVGSAKAKKLSNHQNSQQYQSIKPYESLQLPANHQSVMNQNLKPMSKKVSKKQPISSTPITNLIGKNGSNVPVPLSKACMNIADFQKQKRSPAIHKPKLSQRDRFQIAKNCDISMVQQKQSLFNSFFSNMTSFLTQNKYIYVVGGLKQQSINMIKLNLNTLKWEKVSSLKAPRSKFGCVAIDKSIYVIGGKKQKQRVSDVQIWGNGQWTTGQMLKKKRSGFGIIAHEHFIYVVGGNDGESILNTVEILNTVTGEWTKTQSMNQPRDQLAVCMGKDNRFYAIGGFGGKNNQPLKTVQMYDINTQKWKKVPSLSIARRALAAASLADGIYAIGGFDGTKHLSSVQKYQQGGNEWVKIADLKRGRCTHAAISIFDTQQIIVMGGFDEEVLDSVEKYSLITNQWEQIERMPEPRFMHSCVLFSQ